MPLKIIRKWPTGEQTKVSRYMALEEINRRLNRPHQWADAVGAFHKDKEWVEEREEEEQME
jgi:hypothetical protein